MLEFIKHFLKWIPVQAGNDRKKSHKVNKKKLIDKKE